MLRGDPDLSGGDARANTLLVAPERDTQARQQPDQPATHVVPLSAVKRAAGARSIVVQIVGVAARQAPTAASIIAIDVSDSGTNRPRTDTHRFVAHPREVGAAKDHVVRILVQ